MPTVVPNPEHLTIPGAVAAKMLERNFGKLQGVGLLIGTLSVEASAIYAIEGGNGIREFVGIYPTELKGKKPEEKEAVVGKVVKKLLGRDMEPAAHTDGMYEQLLDKRTYNLKGRSSLEVAEALEWDRGKPSTLERYAAPADSICDFLRGMDVQLTSATLTPGDESIMATFVHGQYKNKGDAVAVAQSFRVVSGNDNIEQAVSRGEPVNFTGTVGTRTYANICLVKA